MRLDEEWKEMKLPKGETVVTEIGSLPDNEQGTKREEKCVKVQNRLHFGYSL